MGEEDKSSSLSFAVARVGEEDKSSSLPFAVARVGEENRFSSSPSLRSGGRNLILGLTRLKF
ncbi:MAG: hypothetical protein NT012_02180 [Candidatus Nealsonbacteria bacterium]|nr:hypothetical protein [Candidatus Nealsonbacteria bacterium]